PTLEVIISKKAITPPSWHPPVRASTAHCNADRQNATAIEPTAMFAPTIIRSAPSLRIPISLEKEATAADQPVACLRRNILGIALAWYFRRPRDGSSSRTSLAVRKRSLMGNQTFRSFIHE